MTPLAHFRSLPRGACKGLFAAPGARASFEAARQEAPTPLAHFRSLPRGACKGLFAAPGARASFEAARQVAP